MTSPLFSPLRLGAFELASRIVMAPMTRNRAPGAVPNAMMADYYAQRADPALGAALIVSEGTAITHQAQGYSDVPGLYADEQIAGWKRVTDAVHAKGGHIFCQLWHVGRVSHHLLQPGHVDPVAPSALRADARTYLAHDDGTGSFVATSMPRALTRDEIPVIVHDYAAAARNAIDGAGFDGVEIHGANGYLPEQFLKSASNQRSDDYGGSIANRCRFLLEVTRAVCDAVGGARTGIRLSPVTPANGIHDEQPQPLYEHLARALAPLGLAYLHIIEGATGGPRVVEGQAFDYAAFKAAWRGGGAHGAWMVNNHYDAALAQQALASGYADLVAFGRPFISMPNFAEHLRCGLPYQKWDRNTLYGGGAKGYIDYPLQA